MTMGASFALEGRTRAPQPIGTRTTEISPSATAHPGRGPGATASSAPSRTGDARPTVDTRCVPGAKTDHRAPNEHAAAAAAAASPAHQTCDGSDRGSALSAPAHQHANGNGNGPTTGAGNANARGGGSAKGGGSASGGGNANAKGSAVKGATAPGRSQDHPTGPPATPGGARNGPPG
jgi:hypothetical protein